MLLEDMTVYNLAVEVSENIWEEIKKWDNFEKFSIGNQLSRSIDSVGANIAEGFGRYHTGEKIKFYYYARGSVYESQHWIKRCRDRRLIYKNNCMEYLKILQTINKELNLLIKTYINKRS